MAGVLSIPHSLGSQHPASRTGIICVFMRPTSNKVKQPTKTTALAWHRLAGPQSMGWLGCGTKQLTSFHWPLLTHLLALPHQPPVSSTFWLNMLTLGSACWCSAHELRCWEETGWRAWVCINTLTVTKLVLQKQHRCVNTVAGQSAKCDVSSVGRAVFFFRGSGKI